MGAMLSVVIPVYNVDNELFKVCMDSLLRHKDNDCELIIVDDGSTNGCQAICDEYSRDNDVKVIHQKNSGVAVARNTGLSYASGKYITFVDPDDMVTENFYFSIRKCIENRSDDIVYFAYRDLSGGNEYTRRYYDSNKTWHGDKILECIETEFAAILPGGDNTFVTVWASVYNTGFLREKSISFEPSLRKVQDLVFNLYALNYATEVSYCSDEIYIYRNNPDSICHSYNPNIAEYYRRVLVSLDTFSNVTKYSGNRLISDGIDNWKIFFVTDIVLLDLLNEKNTLSVEDRRIKYQQIVEMREFKRPRKLSNLQYYKSRNFLGKCLIRLFFKKKFYWLLVWRKIVEIRDLTRGNTNVTK